MKKPFARSLLAAVLAGVVAGAPASPVLAQDPSSQEPNSPKSAPAPPTQGAVPISLGVSKHDYSHAVGGDRHAISSPETETNRLLMGPFSHTLTISHAERPTAN